jgi:hypothetical protein
MFFALKRQPQIKKVCCTKTSAGKWWAYFDATKNFEKSFVRWARLRAKLGAWEGKGEGWKMLGFQNFPGHPLGARGV